MSLANTARPPSTPSTDEVMVRSVTVIAGVVVALTFIFGFGNVLNLALHLGVPVWVAPLIAPAVDLSLLGTRHLALHSATPEQRWPARRLLIFASAATLALNVADPIATGNYGKAGFDAVGPLLLVGWAEVGPGLLQAITATSQPRETIYAGTRGGDVDGVDVPTTVTQSSMPTGHSEASAGDAADQPAPAVSDGDLVDRARQEDARHWVARQRPVSAETLRKNLHIGAARSRMLVSIIRAERSASQGMPATMDDQSKSG
jgi:hypothetical protein